MALGVLALIQYLRGRPRQVRAERAATRSPEGRSHGGADADGRWREWNARRREAYRRNEPFTEPPPRFADAPPD